MAKVKLISITPDAEKIIVYCARVSNPKNQDNPNVVPLLDFCIKQAHWSIFEMAHMTVEIETSRAISHQIVRHKSGSFMEYSQRYSKAIGFEEIEIRRQDKEDRQNSIDDLPEETKQWFKQESNKLLEQSKKLYEEALDKGIAKECARFILPECTTTRLYMCGNIRSWIHYLELRTGHGTQKEHMDIAREIKKIFCQQLPIISKALGWSEKEELIDYGEGLD